MARAAGDLLSLGGHELLDELLLAVGGDLLLGRTGFVVVFLAILGVAVIALLADLARPDLHLLLHLPLAELLLLLLAGVGSGRRWARG